MDQLKEIARSTPEWRPASEDSPPPVKIYEAPDDPHRLGRLYLKARERGGKRAVVFHQGEMHVWEDSAYRPLPDHEMNSRTAAIAKSEFDRINPIEVKAWEDRGRKDRRGRDCDPPVVRRVSTHLISDIALAIRSETLLSGAIEPPAWLIPNSPFPATDVLPTSNLLVHLPSYVEGKAEATCKPTPDFFCPYALDYAFNPNAPSRTPGWNSCFQSGRTTASRLWLFRNGWATC